MLKVCRAPGCTAKCRGGFCEKHLHRKNPARPRPETQREADLVRRSLRWQRLRVKLRREYPFCADPFRNHGRMPHRAEDVHHIVSIRSDPGLAHDYENLLPLCKPCHSMLEAHPQKERLGKIVRRRMERRWEELSKNS